MAANNLNEIPYDPNETDGDPGLLVKLSATIKQKALPLPPIANENWRSLAQKHMATISDAKEE